MGGGKAQAAGPVVPLAAAQHTVGSKVWVVCADDGWQKGEVVKVEGGQLRVRLEGGRGEQLCAAEDCPLQNPSLYGNGVEVGGCTRLWGVRRAQADGRRRVEQRAGGGGAWARLLHP